jgi:hypothetical protein
MSTDDATDQTTFPKAPPACPSCGSAEVARVLWGMPGQEMIDQAQREDIDFGGCCMTEDAPDFRCRACNTTWRKPRSSRV